jgi:hypothetical protein
MDNISRRSALQHNLPTYTSKKPCKRGHLSERRTKTSACLACEKDLHLTGYYDKYRTDENSIRLQFTSLRLKAKSQGIPFDIELDDIDKPEFCPILGLKLNYGWSNKPGEKRNQDKSKAVFDKVIPELGYIKGNVFMISHEANRLKSNMSSEIARKIATYIEDRT